MENVTLIKFQKNNGLASVRKSNGEHTLNDRANIFYQLVGFANDKKLKMQLSRIPDGVDESVGFIMKNANSRIIIEFEDPKDKYYSQLEQLYIKRQIEQKHKVNKFTTFVSTAALLAFFAGGTLYANHIYDEQQIAKNNEFREYYTQVLQEDSHSPAANAYFEYTSNNEKPHTR